MAKMEIDCRNHEGLERWRLRHRFINVIRFYMIETGKAPEIALLGKDFPRDIVAPANEDGYQDLRRPSQRAAYAGIRARRIMARNWIQFHRPATIVH